MEVVDTRHEAWRWNKVKRKTDRPDALKLARLSAMHQVSNRRRRRAGRLETLRRTEERQEERWTTTPCPVVSGCVAPIDGCLALQ